MLRIHTKDKEKFITGGVFLKNLVDLVAAMLGLLLTFPLFISVILRFKQIVPFPSLSRWYRLQVTPFLFDLLLFSHSVVSSSVTPWTAAHQASLFARTHVHRVGDAVQPSHSLLSPSPSFSLSQHQSLFQ